MAYVVIALGVLMAAAGLYSMVFGYPLIETEHGPASLIAGSVLLSGGFVVMALGLAIRALAEIRAALRARPSLSAETLPAAARIERPPVTLVEPPAARDAVPALAGAAAAAAVVKTAEPLADPAPDEPRPSDLAPGPIDAPPLAAVEPASTWPEPEPHAADAAKADEPMPDGYQLQLPSTPEHDIAHAGPPHVPSPVEEEDWLDRALADFETGLSPTHPAEVLAPEHVSNAAEDAATAQAEVPPVHPEPAAAAPAEAEPAHADPVDAAPADVEPSHPIAEPGPPPAQEPAPHGTAPHDLAVIGHYESDGTSYVMYADGSIEAQSEAGVYRFRSMAELKAFIEG